MKNEKHKKWLHIVLWGLMDLLLIIPVIFMLWWFGQWIEEKRQQPAPSDSYAIYEEIGELPGEDLLQEMMIYD